MVSPPSESSVTRAIALLVEQALESELVTSSEPHARAMVQQLTPALRRVVLDTVTRTLLRLECNPVQFAQATSGEAMDCTNVLDRL